MAEPSRRNGKPANRDGERLPSKSGAEPQPQEFTRFEALTRKLLRVPKSELDAKRRTT